MFYFAKFQINLKNQDVILIFFFSKFEMTYATKTQTPPTLLIFSSADLEKYLAFTITGCLGKTPLPRTL